MNFSGSLSASARINELWSWRVSIQSGFVPSPTQGNFVINSWTLRSQLNRVLDIGGAALGVDLELADNERVGAGGGTSGSEDFASVFLSYGRPLFNERMDFSTTIRYSENSGQNDWSQVQLTAELGISF
jgi:hypothetical protein